MSRSSAGTERGYPGVQGAAMSAPARRHDAGDIPTGCPSDEPLDLARHPWITSSLGPRARWGHARRGGPATRPVPFDTLYTKIVHVHTPVDNCKMPIFQGSGNLNAGPCDIRRRDRPVPGRYPIDGALAAADLARFSRGFHHQRPLDAPGQPRTIVDRGVNAYQKSLL